MFHRFRRFTAVRRLLGVDSPSSIFRWTCPSLRCSEGLIMYCLFQVMFVSDVFISFFAAMLRLIHTDDLAVHNTYITFDTPSQYVSFFSSRRHRFVFCLRSFLLLFFHPKKFRYFVYQIPAPSSKKWNEFKKRRKRESGSVGQFFVRWFVDFRASAAG